MISFAVTAYNEMADNRDNGRKLLRCISAAKEHPGIDEIVVVDDGSEDWPALRELLTGIPKVKAYHNNVNRGVFGNKVKAISCCTGDWVMTCDSDNFMDTGYLDSVLAIDRHADTWYCPSFAKPKFDYRELVGEYNLRGLARIINHPMFACCGNTGNQAVHRNSFMEVFGKYSGERPDLKFPNWLNLQPTVRRGHKWRLVFDACDSFILNMHWLLAGNSVAIVKGLEYDHCWALGDIASSYRRAPREKRQLSEVLHRILKRECDACQP